MQPIFFFRLSLLLLYLAGFSSTAFAEKWSVLEGARLDKKGYRDGDSFHVRHDGEDYVFRLFYVDTPETDNRYPERVRGQAKYFSISADQTIEIGEEATEFAKDFLSGTFTVYTDWSDGWGHGTRYRAIITKDGVDLGAALVSAGLARNSGFVPDTAWPGRRGSVWEYREELAELQEEAERNDRGAWGFRNQEKEEKSVEDRVEKTPSSLLTDLNSASQKELEDLPRIGPVLAGRIIDGRPYLSMDELDQIRGISDNTIDQMRPFATVVAPPVQPNTALYFKENARYYLDGPVRVGIKSLTLLDDWSPDGFSVALAETSSLGVRGGSIRLFAPSENMNFAIERFRATSTPLEVRAWLRDYEGELILVIYP